MWNCSRGGLALVGMRGAIKARQRLRCRQRECSMPLSDLCTLATRPKPDLTKGKSRLQDKKAAAALEVVDERKFKKAVWLRDKSHCRKCKRKVVKSIERIPNRGEVHHIHGRGWDLRFEELTAILVCLECHEQLTGR